MQPAAFPSHATRLRYLDGWRGLSIICVFVGHFWPLPGIGMGYLGVDMFFVLSGRLMAEILFVDGVSLGKFYRRRISRIWPAMLVFLIAMRIVFADSDFLNVTNFDLMTALTLTLNYAVAFGQKMPAIENLWSLCIEEWAYILLGLFAFFGRGKRVDIAISLMIVAGLTMLNGAVRLALDADFNAAYFRTDVGITAILLSAGLYLFLKRRNLQLPGWLPILLIVMAVIFRIDVFPPALRFCVSTLCLGAAMATLDRAPGWLLKFLGWRPLTQLGLWSFSLYLWQQPFYHLHLHQYASEKKLLLAAFGCALLSFYLIEQPTRRFLNARWGRPALAAAT